MAHAGKVNRPVAASILNSEKPRTILDLPSGDGWLVDALEYKDVDIDGVDLFCDSLPGYRAFYRIDLDRGIPDDLPLYEAAICCEGLEHIANPELFLSTLGDHIVEGGKVIITTPNTWYPESRLKFFLKGYFPSFPNLVGKVKRGTHMHIMPWSFSQLYLYLSLSGFTDIKLHNVNERKPKRLFEYIVGALPFLLAYVKRMQAKTDEEKHFWKYAASRQSLFGRHLVVSAVKITTAKQ